MPNGSREILQEFNNIDPFSEAASQSGSNPPELPEEQFARAFASGNIGGAEEIMDYEQYGLDTGEDFAPRFLGREGYQINYESPPRRRYTVDPEFLSSDPPYPSPGLDYDIIYTPVYTPYVRGTLLGVLPRSRTKSLPNMEKLKKEKQERQTKIQQGRDLATPLKRKLITESLPSNFKAVELAEHEDDHNREANFERQQAYREIAWQEANQRRRRGAN